MDLHMRLTVVVVAAALLAACSPPPAPPPAEPPSLDVTSWTDTTELFMEYPPFVAGATTRFAVHLTVLSTFAALNAGRPSIEMTPESGGAAVTLAGTPPLRPGAFRVEGTMPPAGRYRWVLRVDAPGVSDRHDLGLVTVFADDASANADAEQRPEGDAAAISYLKEAQWTTPFATHIVREADLRSGVRAPAVVRPLTGGEAVVSAPAAGRFTSATPVSLGQTVAAGHILGRLEPRLAAGADRATLASDVTEARAAVEAARTDASRAERLLNDRAVPARRVEDARRVLAVAETRLQSAEARLAQRDEALSAGGGTASGNAYTLRAPIAGRVAEIAATLGASYDEGAPLFRVVRTDQVELQVLVPVADAHLAQQVDRVELELPGQSEPIALRPYDRHDTGVIDAATRALSVEFSVVNPGGRLLIGQSGTAALFGSARQTLLTVPKEAVLMEAGRPYVFVQAGGEQFLRRPVEIGLRDGNVVGLTSGVRAGERVVTRGAYDVLLASAASGLAAEGHVH